MSHWAAVRDHERAISGSVAGDQAGIPTTALIVDEYDHAIGILVQRWANSICAE